MIYIDIFVPLIASNPFNPTMIMIARTKNNIRNWTFPKKIVNILKEYGAASCIAIRLNENTIAKIAAALWTNALSIYRALTDSILGIRTIIERIDDINRVHRK